MVANRFELTTLGEYKRELSSLFIKNIDSTKKRINQSEVRKLDEEFDVPSTAILYNIIT